MAPAARRLRQSTPELIVRAAEHLFATHGIEAVSFRQIATAAGQRSTGAVQYHFGNKEAVVRALFEFRFAGINDRQLALFAKLKGEDRLDDPRAAIELMVLPLAEELETESSFLGVLVRVRHYPEETRPIRAVPREVAAGGRRVASLINKHLRGLPPRVRHARRDAVAAAVITALSDRQLAMREQRRSLIPTELFLADLIDGATAMLTAPSSSVTASLLKGTGSR